MPWDIGFTGLEVLFPIISDGAASEAARRSLEDLTIKEMGRRKSKCFRLYIRPNLFVSFTRLTANDMDCALGAKNSGSTTLFFELIITARIL